jgi:hypothetical protein
MPEQQGPFYFIGKRGNIVGYVRDGKYYYRSWPLHVDISTGTKLENADIGRAAKAGRLIRNATKPLLAIPCDHQYQNRLNKILLNILYTGNQGRVWNGFQHLNLSGLTGFQFNEQSQINSIVTFEGMELDKHNNLRIPFLPLKGIRDTIKTTHIEIKTISLAVNLIENNYSFPLICKALVDLTLPSFEIRMKLLSFSPRHGEAITIMQVRAFTETSKGMQPSKSVKYLAAGIIRATPCL